jgi:Protein of unknown function (DUF3244).
MPNPAGDIVTLLLKGASPNLEADWSTLRVYDIVGAMRQLKYAGPRHGSETQLSLAQLAPGTYYIRIATSDGGSVTAQFVKQ